MLQIDRRVHGKIEHIVIEITALDAILPGAAENCVYLPCKQRRRVIQADLIGTWQQPILVLKGCVKSLMPQQVKSSMF